MGAAVSRGLSRGLSQGLSFECAATKLRAVVEGFVAACARPALLETGEDLFPLQAGCYMLDERNGGLLLHVWDEQRSLARRVTGLVSDVRVRLTLKVERFGKKQGIVTLLDLNAPGNHGASQRGRRLAFSQRLRVFLRRQFPDYRIAELSSDADLEHSLSPSYPRALLCRGASGWAAIAAPPGAVDTDGVLSFGLIWLDYLRRNRNITVEGLALFVPLGRERTTCLRLRCLDESLAGYRAFTFSDDGGELAIDLRDYGNLDTGLERPEAVRSWQQGGHGPEFRLEAKVRADLECIDARLMPRPVYGQVPAMAGGCHGVLDLLAVERSGRLAVVELKATEDIHLPLQALDYWMRVAWHLERGEFTRYGYFPGIELDLSPPRLMLVAPALHFHSSNEIVLRFFAPRVEVERIGLGVEWQKRVHVMFRASRGTHVHGLAQARQGLADTSESAGSARSGGTEADDRTARR